MQGQIALLLRTFILYPLAGALAAMVTGVAWDATTGQLIVDINATSVTLAALLWGVVSSGTYMWSRKVKANGGVT